jgi:hypothetical protein
LEAAAAAAVAAAKQAAEDKAAADAAAAAAEQAEREIKEAQAQAEAATLAAERAKQETKEAQAQAEAAEREIKEAQARAEAATAAAERAERETKEAQAQAEAARVLRVTAADAEAARQLAAATQGDAQEVFGDDADDLLEQIEDAEESGDYQLLLRLMRLMCSEEGNAIENGEEVLEAATDGLLRLLSASTQEEIGRAGACPTVCVVLHSWMDEPVSTVAM